MKPLLVLLYVFGDSLNGSWHWRKFALGLYGAVTEAQASEVIRRSRNAGGLWGCAWVSRNVTPWCCQFVIESLWYTLIVSPRRWVQDGRTAPISDSDRGASGVRWRGQRRMSCIVLAQLDIDNST
jgi:hypothetical protein